MNSFRSNDMTSPRVRCRGGSQSIVQPTCPAPWARAGAGDDGEGGIIRRRMVHPSARSRAFATAEQPHGAAPSLRQAREFCARLAREHYENFPVASWLLPRHLRPAVQAIYAFARIADDFADEAKHEGQRLKRLDEWERMLNDCFRGEAFHPVFVALREAVRAFGLPPQPFLDLLAAFRMDVE